MVTTAQIAIVLGITGAAIVVQVLLAAGFQIIARRTDNLLDDDMIKYFQWPTFFLFPILAVLFALPILQLDSVTYDIVRHAIVIALILVVTWMACSGIHVTADFLIRHNDFSKSENNLKLRRARTQSVVITRTLSGIFIVAGIGAAILTFPQAYQVGASLLASAGIISLIVSYSAKPAFENMVASLQIALTQPITLDDEVFVDGEYGRIEEIESQFVVLRTWDERRIIHPLSRFTTQSFENWSRYHPQKLAYIYLYVDYSVPVPELHKKLQELCNDCVFWDRRVCVTHVTDATATTIQVRFLVSARNAGIANDLKMHIRQHMIAYINEKYPEALPKSRTVVSCWRCASNGKGGVDTHEKMNCGTVGDLGDSLLLIRNEAQ